MSHTVLRIVITIFEPLMQNHGAASHKRPFRKGGRVEPCVARGVWRSDVERQGKSGDICEILSTRYFDNPFVKGHTACHDCAHVRVRIPLMNHSKHICSLLWAISASASQCTPTRFSPMGQHIFLAKNICLTADLNLSVNVRKFFIYHCSGRGCKISRCSPIYLSVQAQCKLAPQIGYQHRLFPIMDQAFMCWLLADITHPVRMAPCLHPLCI